MTKNEKLVELYKSIDVCEEIDDYNSKLKDTRENTVYPLFLKTDKRYEESDIKIMIFGKETNGWGGTYGNGVTVEEIIKEYEKFFLSGYCYCYSYGGQFWNGVKHLHDMIKNKFNKQKVEYLWNNNRLV
jgi:hypothetical protein